jgi:hypothetical protein
MNGLWYLLGAYSISILLLWGYAVSLWMASSRLGSRLDPEQRRA